MSAAAPRGGREPSPTALTRIARALVLAPIIVYRRVLSPALPRRCKYEPTCSRYTVDAISEYGILRGLVLGVWRLLRCNPWSHGGYDPVEDQRVFRIGASGSGPEAPDRGGAGPRAAGSSRTSVDTEPSKP